MFRMRDADSGHRLSYEERELIEEMLAAGRSPAEIARATGRHRSTICREVKRHARLYGHTPSGTVRLRPYAARIAQLKACLLYTSPSPRD